MASSTGGRLGAVITAGGRSSRLGALGHVIPKGLLPLAAPRRGRPPETAIGRIVDALRAGGVGDIAIAATDHPWFDITAASYRTHKVVVPPTGEYDAVRLGFQALPRCETVAVVSSDNVFAGRGLEEFIGAPSPEVTLVAAAWKPAIRRYTEVTTTFDEGFELPRVTGLVEKPDHEAAGLAKAGAYRFPGDVLDELVARPIGPDRFGERSMTEALLRVLAGAPLLAFELALSFLDIGTPDGLDEAIQALTDEWSAATGPIATLQQAPS